MGHPLREGTGWQEKWLWRGMKREGRVLWSNSCVVGNGYGMGMMLARGMVTVTMIVTMRMKMARTTLTTLVWIIMT